MHNRLHGDLHRQAQGHNVAKLNVFTIQMYKQHNTVKFLVGIAPKRANSFLSKAWCRWASDVVITRESGFLDKVERDDLILADRGFHIAEELALETATLELPPPGSSAEHLILWSAPRSTRRHSGQQSHSCWEKYRSEANLHDLEWHITNKSGSHHWWHFSCLCSFMQSSASSCKSNGELKIPARCEHLNIM